MKNVPHVDVAITATIRVLSTIQGRVLSNAEEFKITISVLRWTTEDTAAMKEICDTAVRNAFVKLFVIRLRNDPALKGKIGGTKWSVDPMLVNYEVLSLEKV